MEDPSGSKRRQWDRQQIDIQIAVDPRRRNDDDQSQQQSQHDQQPDRRRTDFNAEHIRKLQELNKKIKAARELRNAQNKEIEEREKGFNVFFQGANESRVKQQRKMEQERVITSPAGSRPQWQQQTKRFSIGSSSGKSSSRGGSSGSAGMDEMSPVTPGSRGSTADDNTSINISSSGNNNNNNTTNTNIGVTTPNGAQPIVDVINKTSNSPSSRWKVDRIVIKTSDGECVVSPKRKGSAEPRLSDSVIKGEQDEHSDGNNKDEGGDENEEGANDADNNSDNSNYLTDAAKGTVDNSNHNTRDEVNPGASADSDGDASYEGEFESYDDVGDKDEDEAAEIAEVSVIEQEASIHVEDEDDVFEEDNNDVTAADESIVEDTMNNSVQLSRDDIAFLRQSLMQLNLKERYKTAAQGQGIGEIEEDPTAHEVSVSMSVSDIPKQPPEPELEPRQPQKHDAAVGQSVALGAGFLSESHSGNPTLALLINKMKGLDKAKQEYLLQILDNLERSPLNNVMPLDVFDNTGPVVNSIGIIDNSSSNSNGANEKSTVIVSQTNPIERTSTKETVPDSNNNNNNKQVLCLRVISTWGNDRTVGLTEVEVFGRGGKKIPINESMVQIHGSLGATAANAMTIFNGRTKTTSDKHMWQTPLPPASSMNYFEIHLLIPADELITSLRIWNYNRSLNESVKGVKDMEILLNDRSVWKGVIKKGCGNNTFDYSTSIPIAEDDTPPVGDEDKEETKKALQNLESLDIGNNFSSPTLTFSKPVSVPSLSLAARLSNVQQQQQQTLSGSVATTTNTPSDGTSVVKETEYKRPTVQDLGRKLAASIDKPPKIPSDRHVLMNAFKKARPDQLPIWLTGATTPSRQSPSLFSNEDASGSIGTPTTNSSAASITDPDSTTARRRNSANTVAAPSINESADVADSLYRPSSGRRSGRPRSIMESPSTSPLDSPLAHLASLDSAMDSKGKQLSSRSRDPSPRPGSSSRAGISSSVTLSPSKPAPTTTTTTTITAGGNSASRKKVEDEWDSLANFRADQANRLKSEEPEVETASNNDVAQKGLKPVSASSSVFDSRGSSSFSTKSIRSHGPLGESFDLSEGIIEDDDYDDEDDLMSEDEALSTDYSQNASGCNNSDAFQIPLLPRGLKMTITIFSTWGDPHYVGLSGLEMFDETGSLIRLDDVSKQLRADPADINVLPEYSNDPRTIDKILDGVNRTSDDMHVWLAPFTPGRPNYIYITFNTTTTLSMLRFFNYNKSRIHSYRGARNIQITLDGRLIFKGDIQQAPGDLENIDKHAECILFTTDERILRKIEEYDRAFENEQQQQIEAIQKSLAMERPKTAGRNSISQPLSSFAQSSAGAGPSPSNMMTYPIEEHFKKMSSTPRPFTAARPMPATRAVPKLNALKPPLPEGRIIRIDFLSSWGDMYYVGMTGIAVLDENNNEVPLDVSQLQAVPRDMNAIPGHSGDYRTLEKLVNGNNITTDDTNMWLIPLTIQANPHLTIDLRKRMPIAGIKIWNYNKSLEDSFRGVKKIRISVDSTVVSPPGGHIVRKAPGNTSFDFGHTIFLSKDPSTQLELMASTFSSSIMNNEIKEAIIKAKSSRAETPRQDYETPLLPSGYVFKFVLYTTLGDPFYIGLNGLELYDAAHNKINLTINNIQAVPRGINELPDCAGDTRTLDKLIDGENFTWDDEHMWLAPYTPGKPNYLYVIFEEPVAISMVKLWNYSKTPSRGVEEMEIYADDVLIYRGLVRPAPATPSSSDFAHSILFTNDQSVIAREKNNMYMSTGREQEVAFYNDQKLATRAVVQQQYNNNNNNNEIPLVRPSTSTVAAAAASHNQLPQQHHRSISNNKFG